MLEADGSIRGDGEDVAEVADDGRFTRMNRLSKSSATAELMLVRRQKWSAAYRVFLTVDLPLPLVLWFAVTLVRLITICRLPSLIGALIVIRAK